MAVRFRTKSAPAAAPRHLELYTDGSLAGWGWVLAPLGRAADPLEGRSGLPAILPATNNRCELEGILRGLQVVVQDYPHCTHLTVRSDSQYSIGVVELGHRARVNQDLVEACKAEVRRLRGRGTRCDFHHVKAHSGDVGNEMADQLAGLWRC